MPVARSIRVAIVVGALAGAASFARGERRVEPDAVAALRRSLPTGWTLAIENGDLVIRHATPVRVAGHHLVSAHTGNIPVLAPPDAPTITLELRYRLERRWTAAQLATARRANAQLQVRLRALRDRYRIDELGTIEGAPRPSSEDERRRLADYRRSFDRAVVQLVQLPRCTLGGLSVFDDEQTYRQLDTMVDPPAAMREAYAIVELVKRRCR